MRKSLILMLIATLLVGAILVSCNSDISSESSNGDKLVEISISGNDKGISAIATADNADDYYWYYTATKADNSVYRTGQTANWTPIKKAGETNDNFTAGLTGRSLGYFSKGDWKFSFRAYSTKQTSFSDDGFAYYQNDLGVKVEDSTKYVTVTVKESSLAANADVVFNTLNWKYTPENNTGFDETLSYLNGKEVYMFFAYSVDGVNYTSLARSKGTVYTFDGSDKKMGDEGFAFPGIFAKAEFTSFYKYEGSEYSSTATDVKLPASVSGKALTLKYWVETVPVGNDVAEEIGTPSYISVTAYSGGKVTVSVDSTGVAVSGNEHLEEVIIDKGVISVVATKEAQIFTVKDTENPTSTRVSNTEAIVFETQVTGVSAEESTSEKKTTVTFPADSLVTSENTTTDASVNVSMEVVVYQTEAAAVDSTFSISSSTTFAGLTLDVTLIETVNDATTETKVDQFNGKEVTIVTYIAKGLTNVNVANKSGEYIVSGSTNYNPETGRLEFKTTHFSDFAVGADQNVYDKTSNTGYRIGTSVDGTEKEGLLLNGVNAVVAVNNDHEYLLLDATKANDVADSIDAFNSYINWSVVHPSSDTPNTTKFAGGYGTKVEPYLINTLEQFKNISYTNYFTYYKVGTSGLTFDCSHWDSLKMHGSIDGSGTTINNLDKCLFDYIYGEKAENCVIKNFDVVCNIFSTNSAASLMYSVPYNLLVENVDVSGIICGYSVGGFLDFGAAQWEQDYKNVKMLVSFKNCLNTATLISYGEGIGGFIQHPFCDFVNNTNGESLITVIDSAYVGVMKSVSSNMDYFAYQGNYVLVKESYSDDFISFLKSNNYINNSINGELHYTCTPNELGVINCGNYSSPNDRYRPNDSQHKYTIALSGSGNLPGLGEPFVVNKASGAVLAKVSFMIAPNDAANETGSYLSSYMSEEIDISSASGSFSTNSIKYWNIDVNAEGVTSQGLDSSTNTYHVYDGGAFYGHTHNGASVYVIQYDNTNDIVGITKFAVAAPNAVSVMYNGSPIKPALAGSTYSYNTGLDLTQYDVKVVFVDRDASWYYNNNYYAEFNGVNNGDQKIDSSRYQTQSTFEVSGTNVIIYNVEQKPDRYNYGALRYDIRVVSKTN